MNELAEKIKKDIGIKTKQEEEILLNTMLYLRLHHLLSTEAESEVNVEPFVRRRFRNWVKRKFVLYDIKDLQKEDLSVQSLSVQKRNKRLEIRLPCQLKILIEDITKRKNKSASELTILLWLDYLSKTGFILGRVVNQSAEEQRQDIEHFLNNA